MSAYRILIVTNIPSYHQVDLFDALARHEDIDLHVVYLYAITEGRHWTKMPEPDHSAERLPYRQVARINVHPGMARALRDARPDLVIVGQYSALAYQQTMYTATAKQIPWVFWAEPSGVKFFEVRSGVPDGARAVLRRLALWPATRFATAMWGIGVNAQRQYSKVGRYPAENYPYFSNLKRFARGDGAYAPDGVVRLLFAGRFSYRKGFDTLIEATAKLAARDDLPPWKLTLHGRGDLGELLGQHPELSGRVVDGGFLELADMPLAMQSHDVFVTPSRYDGWGMVIPEALAAGMPVVATHDMGSAVDIAEQHPTQMLTQIASGDADALAQAMAGWIRRRDELATLGAEAVEVAMNYDVSSAITPFLELVEQAVSKRRQNRRQ